MNRLKMILKHFLIDGEGEIHSRIEKLGTELTIDGTKALGYCYLYKT